MIKYILTDIEGTTTSISFVVDTLFPYFLDHIDEVESDLDNPLVQSQLSLVKETVLQEENKHIDDQESVKYLIKWCKEDRKHPALKALQGMVWEAGYKNGQLKGHIYPEVASKLNQWKNIGLQLGIYSSGSVPAQKLLFGYSEAGDLTPLFSHYFDTAVGHKREKLSYQNIQKAINLPAEEILFLSDIEQELDAARLAGFSTCKLTRPGTDPASSHKTANNFDEITLN
jgi:enolase-phosphatase E1